MGPPARRILIVSLNRLAVRDSTTGLGPWRGKMLTISLKRGASSSNSRRLKLNLEIQKLSAARSVIYKGLPPRDSRLAKYCAVIKASTVISAAPRVDLAFCMAVMTRVPLYKGLKFLHAFCVGKERSGAALREDFDFGELRYSRSAGRKVDLVGPDGGPAARHAGAGRALVT